MKNGDPNTLRNYLTSTRRKMLERFYNRINLDEKRRKILDDSKEKNDFS